MNFLAHAYLSGKDQQVMLGNFFADAVKGKSYEKFPEKVQRGILLHRKIDIYTDNHQLCKQSKKRLQPKYGKFAGIIVDIYYDHFLAKNWDDYTKMELDLFVSEIYEVLIKNFIMLPSRSKRILPYMVSQNWLAGYANEVELKRVFQGMSRRTRKYNTGMENAVTDLKKNYDQFREEFEIFFPDIINYVMKEAGINLQKFHSKIKKVA